MTNMVFVIDMLNAFCKKGGSLYSENAEAIISVVKKYLKKRLNQGWQIIRIEDCHLLRDPEVKFLGQHAMAEAKESNIVDELSFLQYNPNVELILKSTYDSFMGAIDARNLNSGLFSIIKTANPDMIEIVGVCTDICVFQTTCSLVCLKNAEKISPDIDVKIIEDCVATFDDENYTAEEKTRFVFNHLKKWYGVRVIASTQEQ